MRFYSIAGFMVLSLTATIDGSPYPPPNNQNRDLEAGLNLASSIINALSGPTQPILPNYPPYTPFIPPQPEQLIGQLYYYPGQQPQLSQAPQSEQLVPAPNNPGYFCYPSNPGQLYYYPGQQPQLSQAPQSEQLVPAPNNPGYFCYPSNPGQLYYYPDHPPDLPPSSPLAGTTDTFVQQAKDAKPQGSQNETPVEHPDKPGHFFYPSNNKQLYIYVNKELVPLEQKKKEKLIESNENPGYYYYPSDPKTLIKPDDFES